MSVFEADVEAGRARRRLEAARAAALSDDDATPLMDDDGTPVTEE